MEMERAQTTKLHVWNNLSINHEEKLIWACHSLFMANIIVEWLVYQLKLILQAMVIIHVYMTNNT
jgi:hypothetical protein